MMYILIYAHIYFAYFMHTHVKFQFLLAYLLYSFYLCMGGLHRECAWTTLHKLHLLTDSFLRGLFLIGEPWKGYPNHNFK